MSLVITTENNSKTISLAKTDVVKVIVILLSVVAPTNEMITCDEVLKCIFTFQEWKQTEKHLETFSENFSSFVNDIGDEKARPFVPQKFFSGWSNICGTIP